MDTFLIGDLLLKVNMEGVRLATGKYMEKFRYHGPWEGDTVTFNGSIEPLESYLQNRITEDNGVYEIYNFRGELVYAYHWGRLFHGFVMRPAEFSVGFAPRMTEQIPPNEDWFFGVSGLHHQFLQRGASVLHASCINYNGRGILFSAPSQTGKSTQASLWKQYMDARIINGDRGLLRQRQGRWHVFGFPCCGSSQICENSTIPLSIIVCLRQGAENRVEQMTYGERISALVSGMEFYQWDKWEMERVFEIAEQIVREVPVIRLVCRPEEGAVLELKKYLIQEGVLYDF